MRRSTRSSRRGRDPRLSSGPTSTSAQPRETSPDSRCGVEPPTLHNNTIVPSPGVKRARVSSPNATCARPRRRGLRTPHKAGAGGDRVALKNLTNKGCGLVAGGGEPACDDIDVSPSVLNFGGDQGVGSVESSDSVDGEADGLASSASGERDRGDGVGSDSESSDSGDGVKETAAPRRRSRRSGRGCSSTRADAESESGSGGVSSVGGERGSYGSVEEGRVDGNALPAGAESDDCDDCGGEGSGGGVFDDGDVDGTAFLLEEVMGLVVGSDSEPSDELSSECSDSPVQLRARQPRTTRGTANSTAADGRRCSGSGNGTGGSGSGGSGSGGSGGGGSSAKLLADSNRRLAAATHTIAELEAALVAANTALNAVSSSAQEEAVGRSDSRPPVDAVSSGDDSGTADDHEVFGKLLHTFADGRRSYAADAHTVINNVGIWLQQRAVCRDRVLQIADAKRESRTFPGVISVFEFVGVDKPSLDVPQVRAVFDGQHRLLAAQLLLSEAANPAAASFELHVEVFPVTDITQVASLFVELNSSVPVQEIDLPGLMKRDSKKLIDEVGSHFQRSYKPMFSASHRCRAPHVHLPSFRNTLSELRIVERRSFDSAAELISHLEEVNAILASKPDKFWPPCVRRHLTKARKFGFFFGLSDMWLQYV